VPVLQRQAWEDDSTEHPEPDTRSAMCSPLAERVLFGVAERSAPIEPGIRG
jgi:hypothetical protein